MRRSSPRPTKTMKRARVKHKGRPAFHCFKAHFGAYADTALVEEVAVTAPTPRTATPFLMLCPTIPAKGLPTAPTRGNHLGDAVRAKGGRPRIIATAMWGRDEAESSTPGTNRSTEFVVGSRRSSVPGNEATTFAGCDGEGWQRKPFKSAALRIAYSMKHSLMVASSPIVEAQRPFSGSPPEIHGGQCVMPYPRFSPPSQMCGSPEAAH